MGPCIYHKKQASGPWQHSRDGRLLMIMTFIRRVCLDYDKEFVTRPGKWDTAVEQLKSRWVHTESSSVGYRSGKA